jgi:hypothetical protein
MKLIICVPQEQLIKSKTKRGVEYVASMEEVTNEHQMFIGKAQENCSVQRPPLFYFPLPFFCLFFSVFVSNNRPALLRSISPAELFIYARNIYFQIN